MAYVVPIHRASSVRHALKIQFFKPEEDCLVVAYVVYTYESLGGEIAAG
jgi:hypothetical protein